MPPPSTPKYLGNGAAAIGLGAASSGLKFVTAYPMTPGTATFTWLAGAADQYGIVVEQAEDEIAAMNMICGAAYAGAPAMTCTSGGGFALMCEGLSLAGMMELPVLVMLAQRPGPATGLPTRTGQEDLKFALNAGHGEFPRAIFAPGSIEECFALSRRALETAHKHQTPVILLTDQFLQDIQKNIETLPSDYRPIDRHILPSNKDYRRYALSTNGASPRSIPGLGEGLVVCDSDEHDESGHLTEDLEMRVLQQRKRMSKIETLLEESLPPSRYGNSKAEILLVCWGSTYGPSREAVDLLNAKRDNSAAMLHFSQVWPLAPEKIAQLLSGAKKIVSIEGNYTGQFRSLLREAGLVGQDCKLIGRYDGLPFNGESIAREIEL